MKKRIISKFKKSANPDLSFSNIPRSDNLYLTHAYHRYPAKFIPGLAAHLINNNAGKNDLICDPFGGCGTALVEAKISGINSIGIDINPLAKLITMTKITAINPTDLFLEKANLEKRLKRKKIIPVIVESERLMYWFEEKNLHELELLFSAISETQNKDIRRFFECCFSHVLKNCSRWLTTSLKPQIDKNKKPANPQESFFRHLKFMMIKNSEFYERLLESQNLKTTAKFYLRDARNTGLKDHSVDYILTSPPYVTSYEYADLHQLSILWFRYAKDWINFKKKFIGTVHRNASGKGMNSLIAEKIVNDLEQRDRGLAKSVKAYFEDMTDFLVEAKRILRKNKKLSLVIGNTMMQGVDILNAEVTFEQMEGLNFKKIEVEKRRTSFQSITPYRDIKSGRFTSIHNPNKRRAYEYEYIISGINI